MPLILYTVREAVDWLAQKGRFLGRVQLSKYCKEKRIRAVLVGREYLIFEEDLEAFSRLKMKRGRPRKT